MSPASRSITRLPATHRVVARAAASTRPPFPTTRPASTAPHQPSPPSEQPAAGKDEKRQHCQQSQRAAEAHKSAAGQGTKSMAELDEALRLRLEGISGEGGASGVEYENGKAEGLKRGVKNNMFRVI